MSRAASAPFHNSTAAISVARVVLASVSSTRASSSSRWETISPPFDAFSRRPNRSCWMAAIFSAPCDFSRASLSLSWMSSRSCGPMRRSTCPRISPALTVVPTVGQGCLESGRRVPAKGDCSTPVALGLGTSRPYTVTGSDQSTAWTSASSMPCFSISSGVRVTMPPLVRRGAFTESPAPSASRSAFVMV